MSSIVILGAGVAGLSAGIYSLMNGYSVTIYEQHSIAGGNLTGWTREHLHIDNCIHWLTGTNKHSSYNKIWRDLGAITDTTKFIKEDYLYSYTDGIETIHLYRNIDKTVLEMINKCPEDKKQIIKFGKAVKLVQKISGIGGIEHDKKLNIIDILKIPTLLKYFNISISDYQKRFKSKLLSNFFEGLLGPEFTSLAFLMVAATFCGDNGDIPEGGSLQMAQRMLNKFKELGGKIETNKKAININIANGKAESVEFEDGTKVVSDNIIATFEPKVLFDSVVKREMPKKYSKLYNSKEFKRFSTIQSAFAIDENLLNFQGTMSIDIPLELQSILHATKAALRESSYEKSYVKNGKKVLQVMIYVNEKTSINIIQLASKQGRERYKQEKEKLANAQLKLLEITFPELKGKMHKIDSWTPASYVKYVGTEIGSWMSFVLPAKTIPRFIKGNIDGVNNLFTATQFNMMPGGLPMAALAGKRTADLIKAQEHI